jgi:hypothetical protein
LGNIFYWRGKVLSVNRWHLARALYDKFKQKWVGRIFENPDFRKYKDSIVRSIKGAPLIEGYVDMQITTCLSPRADTGNIEKAVGDALEDAGVLVNDKFIRNINLVRTYHPNSGSKNKYDDYLIIELTEVPADDLAEIKRQQTEDVFGLKL